MPKSGVMPEPGEKRFCSRCGQQMEWRLSRWECGGCNFVDDPGAAAEQRKRQEELERIAELKGNVRGIQRKPVYKDGRVVGHESDAELTTYAPPTSSALLNPGPAFYGKVEDIHAERPRHPGLETEKKVYFAIHATGVFLAAIASLGSTAIPGGPGFFYAMLSLVFPSLFVYLLWFSLFGDQEWAKWLCGGLAGVGVVAGFIGLLWMLAESPAEFAAVDFQMRGMLSLVLWGSAILQAVFGFWLIGILYRDIQVLRGE